MYNINNGPGSFTVVNGVRRCHQAPKAQVKSNKHIIPADKVIVVMGPTGVGKSTFINVAAGSNQVVVSHALASCSADIKAVEIHYKESKVVLVDTPGFDDTDMSDTDVLGIIAEWLAATYRGKIKLTGIIYMHRITDIRMSGALLKNLRMFANLCGTDAAVGVVITTTMWDNVDPDEGRGREEELRLNYWKDILDHKAQMERFDCREGHEAAWNIIRQLCHRPPPGSLLIQQEMVNLERKLCETMAGKELYSELLKVVEKRKKILKQLSTQAGKADDVDLKRSLRAEYHKLDTELKNLMKQVGSLKVPLSGRLRRMLCFNKPQAVPIPMSQAAFP